MLAQVESWHLKSDAHNDNCSQKHSACEFRFNHSRRQLRQQMFHEPFSREEELTAAGRIIKFIYGVRHRHIPADLARIEPRSPKPSEKTFVIDYLLALSIEQYSWK